MWAGALCSPLSPHPLAESSRRSSLSVLIPITAVVVTCLVGICIYCLVHTGEEPSREGSGSSTSNGEALQGVAMWHPASPAPSLLEGWGPGRAGPPPMVAFSPFPADLRRRGTRQVSCLQLWVGVPAGMVGMCGLQSRGYPRAAQWGRGHQEPTQGTSMG